MKNNQQGFTLIELMIDRSAGVPGLHHPHQEHRVPERRRRRQAGRVRDRPGPGLTGPRHRH
ncbi:prepilin-type N-terminal cleavage/methylation domain-containing protein [Lysobacter sp. Root983]|uniref:prepilin-type N-terminal cleavage/methylation domain-containing protein n=1 Tax=Lysobacter sp. Root983 TaxID=1736613 RepID=UPI001F3C642F|nr:prepilin-type N-terminal cleavage/methylation domain-containing protein [Lysobacter sp. Root983]